MQPCLNSRCIFQLLPNPLKLSMNAQTVPAKHQDKALVKTGLHVALFLLLEMDRGDFQPHNF
jgi:hypothetical protein